MNLLLLGAALISIAIIIYFLRPKKLEQNLIEEKVVEENLPQAKQEQYFKKVDQVRDYHEIEEVVEELKKSSGVRPQGNQQRNLDREVGGVEAHAYVETGEKDVWDDRSDQIDKEGAIDQLGSAAKKSMIWRIKKGKMDNKKHAESADAASAHHENRKQGSGSSFDSRLENQTGFGQMIKARNDFGHEKGGGGMSH